MQLVVHDNLRIKPSTSSQIHKCILISAQTDVVPCQSTCEPNKSVYQVRFRQIKIIDNDLFAKNESYMISIFHYLSQHLYITCLPKTVYRTDAIIKFCCVTKYRIKVKGIYQWTFTWTVIWLQIQNQKINWAISWKNPEPDEMSYQILESTISW